MLSNVKINITGNTGTRCTTRIHRLLQLITLLESGYAKSVSDLLSELNISRRTLFRDLKVLQIAGIPYYYNVNLGYRITRNFYLPPINFTVPETLGLMLMGKLAVSQCSFPLKKATICAITKLTSAIPESIRSACTDMMKKVSVNPGSQTINNRETRYYMKLQRCIDEGRICFIKYQNPTESKPLDFEFKPYAMHFVSRAWYTLGKSQFHPEVCVFKLARIEKLEMLKSHFICPNRFKVEDTLGKAWRLIPEGKLYQVELEFSPMIALDVSEVLWHPSQKQKILSNGRCKMVFKIDGLQEIAWWICSYAGEVRVLNPPTLRNRVKKMLSAAVEQYNED